MLARARPDFGSRSSYIRRAAPESSAKNNKLQPEARHNFRCIRRLNLLPPLLYNTFKIESHLRKCKVIIYEKLHKMLVLLASTNLN